MIPESFIEQLKYKNPIEDVVSSYVRLKRQGRNLKGLCPFHSEKTPSFVVYPDDQNPHYHCFGCGSGGDVITFIRNIENLDYIDSLKLLAARAGMTVPDDSFDDKAARLRSRVLELNRESARFFHDRLKSPEGRDALGNLTGRGLTPKTITRFGLGYAPDTWDSLMGHLRSKGYSEDEMLAGAVVSKGRNGGIYDSFRNRVIFPIIDLRGSVIGFGGRAMEDRGPKYLNSADTPAFKKNRNLYALNFAKNSGSDSLILAEGYMDVIAMHQAGFDYAVATLGTALTQEQSLLIARYSKKVAIAYDSDQAGQAATKRAINLLGEVDVAVSVLEIQGAKDPDEYIKRYGAARFQNLVGGGRSAIDYEIDKIKARHDLDSPDGKSAFLTEFCAFIAGIRDRLRRDIYISEISRELDVGRDALESTVKNMRKKRENAENKRQAHNLTVYAQDKAEKRDIARQGGDLTGFVAERNLIALLLQNPDSYDTVKGLISPEDFVNEDHREIYAAIAERLAENRAPELIHLSARLSTPRIATLTRLMDAGAEIRFYPGQAEEYAQAVRRQHDSRTPEEIGQMNPEQIQRWLQDRRKNQGI